MFQDTYQHSYSDSTQTLLSSSCSSEHDASPTEFTYNTFQSHTDNKPARKLSSQQPRKLGHVISDLVAPALGLVLENKGNVARDHLASERTYLAYVRTSLACANAGVVFAQLLNLSSPSDMSDQNEGGVDLRWLTRALAVTMVLSGLVILAIGLVRFFTMQSALLRGIFPVARNSLAAVSFILATVISLVFGVLFAQMRS